MKKIFKWVFSSEDCPTEEILKAVVVILLVKCVVVLLAVSTMDYNDAKEYEQYKCSMIEEGAWGASEEVRLNCNEVKK